jgi:hypothetical protein
MTNILSTVLQQRYLQYNNMSFSKPLKAMQN